MSLKPHEKILRKLQVNPNTEKVVAALLGLSKLDEVDEEILDAEKVDIRDEFAQHLGLSEYLGLERPKINKTSTIVTGLWGNKDGISTIVNQDEYAQKLESAVDNILPHPSQHEGLVPITIFLPNAVKMDGDTLEGTESCWQFTQILNETQDSNLGIQTLFEQEGLLYGSRLLSIFNSLGTVSIKRSQRNTSDFFSHLVQSTPLHSQFEYLDSKAVQKWKKLQKQLEEEEKAIRKIEEKIDRNERSIFRPSDPNSPNTIAIKDENKQLKVKLKEAVDNLTVSSIDDELDSIQLETTSLSNDFYFAIPNTLYRTLNFAEKDAERLMLLPSLRLKERENYQISSVNIEKGKVANWSLERLRYMLSFLFPMTSGHAITLWIKPESNDITVNSNNVINAPTFVLPSTWIGLVNELKQHSPNKETPDYSEYEDKDDVKGIYKSALYGDFWTKRRELLRAIPEISHTTMSD